MEDFYAVVGIDRNASRDEIDRKIREQLRIWQRRTTNADLSRRQEAERRVQLLGEARTTLLDAEKRRRYDSELREFRAPAPPAEAGNGDVDWLARARQLLADNDYPAAVRAARQARNAPNAPAAAWGVLARANAGLGNLDDAVYEAKQAVALEGDNAQARIDLAHVHEERGEWREAFEQYELASRLDPRAEAPEAGMTRALASSGNPTEGVDRLERRYARALPAERPDAGRLLGRALVTAAEQAARGPGGGFRITGPEQVGEIGRLLERARQVTNDPGVVRSVAELQAFIVRSQHTTPYRSSGYRTRPASPPTTSYRRAGSGNTSPPRTNNLAIAALVCALAGLPICVAAPVGAILGHVARGQIRDRGERGDGIALAAIVIGWVVTAVAICGIGILLSQ
jgi:tetratricopeptide (TPR) repeat protein